MAAAASKSKSARELQAIGRDRNGRRHQRAPSDQNTDQGGSCVAGLAAPDCGAGRLVGASGNRAVRQIGQQPQRRAVAHAPVRRQQAVVGRMRIAERRAREPRHDLADGGSQAVPAPAPAASCPACSSQRVPIEHRGLKRRRRKRIGHLVAVFRIGPGVFPAAALAHGFGEIALEIAEERERRLSSPIPRP